MNILSLTQVDLLQQFIGIWQAVSGSPELREVGTTDYHVRKYEWDGLLPLSVISWFCFCSHAQADRLNPIHDQSKVFDGGFRGKACRIFKIPVLEIYWPGVDFDDDLPENQWPEILTPELWSTLNGRQVGEDIIHHGESYQVLSVDIQLGIVLVPPGKINFTK